MSKFVGIKTYERFRSLWENNDIDEFSLNFILDTGQLYTHGVFINSAVFGTAANGAVLLSIAGTTNTLALSSHTHSNYYDKSENLDITNHKIISGDNDLLFCSGGALYIGNIDNPTYISGSTIQSIKGLNTYTILDTENFSISNTLPTGYTHNNTAYIEYGGNSFLIDYVKRVNTSLSFDYLNSYTLAGTNLLNGDYYGYINFTVDNVYNNPAWAQLRINITGRSIQYRTSADVNNWINLGIPSIPLNALNVAGIVSAPNANTQNKVWKTDEDGNPGWRDERIYSFASLVFQLIAGTELESYNTLTLKTILAGSNISFSCEDNVITINALDTTYSAFIGASASEDGSSGLVTAPNAGLHDKFLRGDGTWNTPLNTWRPIYLLGTATLSNSSTYLNIAPGNNISLSYAAPGTETGLSGNVNYATLTISATNTWIAWQGATDSADGMAGYMPAPTSALRNLFLRGDGTWISLNDYTLPTATNLVLGGIKVGTTLEDVSGYTAIHIKDGVAYYKDTTYSFSNLLFLQTSGTNLMTYNSQAARTILAGSNITFTHNNNILTIAATDTTYSTVSKTAAGLCPILPNETTTTKYLRLDGTWVTPPNDNTWTDFTGATNSAAGTKGVIQAPAGAQNKFFRGDNTWLAISQNVTSALYVGASNGTGNSAQSTNGNVYLIFAEGSSYSRYKISGSGRASVTSDASGNITINSSGYSNFGAATASAAGSAGLVPAPGANVLGSAGYYLRADGTWLKPPNDNTWNANAVGVAGYVAAPTKAANANMTWLTDADGNPAWRASNNHSHSYLPLSGGTISGTGYTPLTISSSSTNNYSTINFKSANHSRTFGIRYNGDLFITNIDGWATEYIILDSNNSSVSKSGETLTVKINGTSQSLTNTNTWRGILDNLTSSSNTTESLSAKQGYLLANGSARDSTKLPLAGGTMTGHITMGGLAIYFGKSGNNAIMSYSSSYPNYGIWYNDASVDTITFSASNNANDATKADFAINGGGDGVLTSRGNKIWHAGNDGSGSGLDADLLDGNHASAFATSGHNHNSSYVSAVAISGNYLRITKNGSNTDLTIPYATDADTVDGEHATTFHRNLGGANCITINVGGNANTYYPVVIGSPSDYYPYQFVSITRSYSETAPDTWNTSTHKGGLSMAIFWNGSRYWDGNASGSEAFVVRLYQSYCTMVGGVDNSTAGKVVWLRGGGANYHIFSMNGTSQSATVYLSTYTDSANRSFAPKTTPDNITVRWPGYADGADYATSAGSASSVAWSNVSSKPETATRWPSWSEVTSKPSTFTPASHTHVNTDITGGCPLWITGGCDRKLYFKDTDGEKWSLISFLDKNGSEYGLLGVQGDSNLLWNNKTIYHSGNLPAYPTKSSWNYNDMYVSSLTTSGNYLRWVKNGSNNDITIPYATNADTVDSKHADYFKSRLVGGVTGKQPGWYYILDCTTYSMAFLITFYGGYSYSPPSPTTFMVSHSYNTTAITQIGKTGYTGWITKLAVVHYDTYKFKVYVYFNNTTYASNKSAANGINFEVTPLDPYARSNINLGNYSVSSITPTVSCDAGTFAAEYANSAGSVAWSNVSSKPETATRWPAWSEVTSKPSTFTPSSHTHSYSQITDGTCTSTSSGWSQVLSNTYGGSLKSILYMCHGGGYGMHLRGYSTSSSVYMLLIYNSSKEVLGVYGDGHSTFGGNVTASNFYTTSDRLKKQNISSFSEHIRKFQLKDTEKWHYGVIALEVPEMFRDGKEGNMTVNYNSVLSYYVGCLENSVAGLEDAKRLLENRVKELELEVLKLKMNNYDNTK